MTQQGHSVEFVNLDFSVATTGVIQIKEHAGRLKHINKHQQYFNQKTLFFGKPAATSLNTRFPELKLGTGTEEDTSNP